MPSLPLDASSRRHAFFSEDGVDQLVSMVLELATELWVVRERLYALEAVADQRGLRAAIESYRPNEQEQAELAAMRARMLSELFRTLGRDHRPARDARAVAEQ
jgi:hypothetical protein